MGLIGCFGVLLFYGGGTALICSTTGFHPLAVLAVLVAMTLVGGKGRA